MRDEAEVRRILSVRQETATEQRLLGPRTLKVPTLQFDASEYTSIIDWKESLLTEHSLTRHLPEENLQSVIEKGLRSITMIWNLSCHTQDVERMIKVVTEASFKGDRRESKRWLY